MDKSRPSAVALTVALLSLSFSASAGNQLWEEYDKLIDKRKGVATFGPEIFGDDVSLYSGVLSFRQTDIALQGNFPLEVALTRKYTVQAKRGYPNTTETRNDAPFGDWEFELPNISGTFAAPHGWRGGDGTEGTRCSQPTAPQPYVFGPHNDFQASEFWHGYHLVLPGGGGDLLASRQDTQKPTSGGPYPWISSNWTYVGCVESLANAPGRGQGFVAVTPDGVRYTFNWMATFHEPDLKEQRPSPLTGEDVLQRRRIALYATRAEDRFGNSVTYTYSNAPDHPVRPVSIQASDGRLIAFEVNADGLISKATAGTQSWQYEYANTGSATPLLKGVVLPDLTRWSLNVASLSGVLQYERGQPGDQLRNCMDPGNVVSGGYTGSITHPSGAVAEYWVEPTRFGRSNVLLMCQNVQIMLNGPNDPNDDSAIYPLNWDTLALTRKRVSGAAIEPGEWTYTYHSTVSRFYSGGGTDELPVCTYGDCIEPQCTSDSCAGTHVTQVHGPGSTFKRYVFGNSYRYNEGKLLRIEEGSSPANVLRTQSNEYVLAQSGQPFPTPVGHSMQRRSGAGFEAEYIRPQWKTTTVQQGVSFNSTTLGFDRFARGLESSKKSSIGPTRLETGEYFDDFSRWVLGQQKRLLVNGIETARSDFNSMSLPERSYAFGKLQQTIGYDARGNLASVTDGRGNVTRLSDWSFGIPGSISYADGTSESAVVDENGWIRRTTDEAGATTCYDYDAGGRVRLVTYTSESAGSCSTARWNATVLTFTKSSSPIYGLPAGHWRRTEETGNARKVTYYDAMWRPVVEEAWDSSNAAATARWTAKRYDAAGHPVFTSYPLNPHETSASWASASAGTYSTFDALGRPTSIIQHTGSQGYSTTIQYLDGFKRRTTNPKGHSTTESFQVFDTPSFDNPTVIDAPKQTRTTIVRDVFGKPQSMTRGSSN